MDHVRLGFAYQMHLNDQWQKCAPELCQPGRAFFVFSRGKRHQETVSLTARMLSRMAKPIVFVPSRTPICWERRHRPRAQAAGRAVSQQAKSDGAVKRRGHAQRGTQAGRVSSTAAGDVECRAVVGLVRTNGSPSVTFTPCSTRGTEGIKPWSGPWPPPGRIAG